MLINPKLFVALNEKGEVQAACIDDHKVGTDSDVAQWVREFPKVVYGEYQSVIIGKPLPENST
jgi:hypothetical protein